ncbi:uncharacterized protein ISCGN_011080 [Ixodes scapularis]
MSSVYSLLPAPRTPTVEQLSRKYPKNFPTSAVIGNSQTSHLFHHFDPYDEATLAFINICGALTCDIKRELANIPRSMTTLIFHVGTSEWEKLGSEETLRRCRRLVNDTLQARPELPGSVIFLVLLRYTNRRLRQPNDCFVHWFINETRKFNDTVKGYCREPGKAHSLKTNVPASVRPVFLPAVASSSYLEKLRRVDFNVFDSQLQKRNGLLPLSLWWHKLKHSF